MKDGQPRFHSDAPFSVELILIWVIKWLLMSLFAQVPS